MTLLEEDFKNCQLSLKKFFQNIQIFSENLAWPNICKAANKFFENFFL